MKVVIRHVAADEANTVGDLTLPEFRAMFADMNKHGVYSDQDGEGTDYGEFVFRYINDAEGFRAEILYGE